jgi:CheY-like chemotaxis protein/anti-sigma regulatory factor (Ser/Thr protein kinase)
VRADARRLSQVLLNLLTNAVKYGPPDAAVKIAAARNGARVRLTVADDGPGIPPDSLARLFTPFERLEATKGQVEGTGLGLALSKRLTEAMEGEIGVASTVGTGTTFFVDLASARAPRAGAPRDQAPAVAARASARGTVLYIEDQLSNQVLVGRILGRREGVRLLSATHGQMGLKLAREYRPDLVLLDLDLPDVPGANVLSELKGDPLTRSAPVVIVSAERSGQHHSRLLEEGATAIMTKPIDVTELLATVDRLLADGGNR